MLEVTLTPCQEEFLELIEQICEENNGVAVSVFEIGVVIGGMSYQVAHQAFCALREQRIIRARKLRNRRGQPWAIQRVEA